MRSKYSVALSTAAVLLIAACSSGNGDSATPANTIAVADTAANDGSETAPATDSGIVTPVDATATIEEVLDATREPDAVDAGATRPCDRYGFVCSLHEASPEQLDTAMAAMEQVASTTRGIDDAREQLRLALVEVAELPDVSYLEADYDTATMLSFSVEGGPLVSVFTEAGQLRDDGEVEPVDEAFVVEPEATGFARPQGLRSAPLPQRYEPAGGPTNRQRSALVVNPFEWSSADDIATIFRGEDEYATVDVLEGSAVNPFEIDTIATYDAVHIITHGGGSCPPWSNDRDACSSTFVGGPIDLPLMDAELAASDSSVGSDFWLCESEGVSRYCFNSNGFLTNPNGIVFFGSCGSDAGFNNTGAGASVGWTGTTQRRIAERTAAEFWRLMVTDGVEFELAAQVVKEGSYDSHKTTWWASRGDVNFFTESVFAGRNLRARDVVSPMVDGELPQGQVVQFNGTPEDSQKETFPANGQEVTFKLEGVRNGSEGAVRFEIRGDGDKWEVDVDLARDGSVTDSGKGYSTWLVTLKPDSVKIPDVGWAELKATAPPIDIEVRAYESEAGYTAELGSIRLGTEVVASGPIPIFEQLASTIGSAGGEVTGNDLRITFNTQGGEATGELHVAMIGQGIQIGTWDTTLEGSYDPATGVMEGTMEAVSKGGIGGITAGDSGSGGFSGQVDLGAKTVVLTLGVGGDSQQYIGTFLS